jgi:hypothetical protein
MTPDATLHPRCGQNFHRFISFYVVLIAFTILPEGMHVYVALIDPLSGGVQGWSFFIDPLSGGVQGWVAFLQRLRYFP